MQRLKIFKGCYLLLLFLLLFLITATKIEFFVGDVPDEQLQDLENARYTRLGWVTVCLHVECIWGNQFIDSYQ